jgi:hypothetical protein
MIFAHELKGLHGLQQHNPRMPYHRVVGPQYSRQKSTPEVVAAANKNKRADGSSCER